MAQWLPALVSFKIYAQRADRGQTDWTLPNYTDRTD